VFTSRRPKPGHKSAFGALPAAITSSNGKDGSMPPRVIQMNECGCTVVGTRGVVPKLLSRIEVMSELVSCRNQRA